MSTLIVYLQSLLVAVGYLALAGSFIYVVLALIRLLFADNHPAYDSHTISKRSFTRKLMRKQHPQADDLDRPDQDIGTHVPDHQK